MRGREPCRPLRAAALRRLAHRVPPPDQQRGVNAAAPGRILCGPGTQRYAAAPSRAATRLGDPGGELREAAARHQPSGGTGRRKRGATRSRSSRGATGAPASAGSSGSCLDPLGWKAENKSLHRMFWDIRRDPPAPRDVQRFRARLMALRATGGRATRPYAPRRVAAPVGPRRGRRGAAASCVGRRL